MNGLVMDGVRRPRHSLVPLVLEPKKSGKFKVQASALVMAQPVASADSSLDGLSRVSRRLLPALPAAKAPMTEAEVDAQGSSRQVWPYAVAALTAIPMITAASVLGVSQALDHLPKPAPVTVMPQPQAAAPVVAQAEAAPAPAPKPVAKPAPVAASSLQALLDNFGHSATYSYYVKDLKTGQLAVVGPDRSFRSASLYKLFVASEIYHRIDNGQLSYSTPIGGNTVAGCLKLMITISDNACGNALGSLIGWSQLTQTLRANGYSGTNLNQPMRTTPRDVAKLYERLYAGNLASPGSNAAFLSLLRAQRVNNRLPQGLPAGTTFAHKTGDLYGYMHDAGIVFGAKTDYLVVMMGAPGATPSNFASLSAKLYSHFER